MYLFFELIQIALGNRDKLTRVPSSEEWNVLYEIARMQAIDGILQYGLERLPAEQRPYLDLLLEWIGAAQVIKAQNELLDKRCIKLLRRLEKIGLRATILKGQGIARLYSNTDSCVPMAVSEQSLSDKDNVDKLWTLRQPGDIDVYVDCGRKEAIKKVQALGIKVIGWDYKHAHVEIWDDTEVELHYHVEVMYNWKKNRLLQKWFDNKLGEIFKLHPETGLVTPTVEFNIFYILLHIYRHFFYEGVGLRQIMDYYFVLKTYNKGDKGRYKNILEDRGHYLKAVKEFGMERFAKGLMWVMQEVMAMPKEWMPWEPDAKEGRFILKQVIEMGYWGNHLVSQQKRRGRIYHMISILQHNMHLLRRYPCESLAVPLWLVGHKVWKIGIQLNMKS